MLISLSGLPGAGKSTIARQLALSIGAVWLRVDSIEQAIREADVLRGDVDGAGYAVACRLARDNLALGHTVVGDCVNPWMLTRDAWRRVGIEAGVPVLEVEIVCGDPDEHRRRIGSREIGVPGLQRVTWVDVTACDYHAWTRARLVLDTARDDVAACVDQVRMAAAARPAVNP